MAADFDPSMEAPPFGGDVFLFHMSQRMAPKPHSVPLTRDHLAGVVLDAKSFCRDA